MYFDEFLHAVTAFCLFTKDEMVMFVFKMFDKDRDDYISKKDVFRHLMIERNNNMVYPVNNLRAIELFKCERGDRIDRKMFLKLVTFVPYLIFPAFRLQEEIKEAIVGFRFWRRIRKRVEARQAERKKIEDKRKIRQRQKQKEEEIKKEREFMFLEHIKHINEADAAQREEDEEEMKLIRNPQRRHTDGFIGVKFRQKQFRKDLEDRLERKDDLLVKYEVGRLIDVPHYERDLHTSLIFERAVKEDIGEKKRVLNIDPTDKRYVFENEIKRFVNEQKANEGEKKKIKDNDLSHGSAYSSYMGMLIYEVA